MTAAEFILGQAQLVGVDITTPEMLALASHPGLNVALPDAAVEKVNNNLFTVARAENHPALEGHYTKKAMEKAELQLKQALQARGLFNDEELTGAWGKPMLTDKVQALMDRLEAKQQAAANTGGGTENQKKDIAALEKQINDLIANQHKQAHEFAQKEQALREEMQKTLSSERTNWRMQGLLATVPVPDAIAALPAAIRDSALRAALDKELVEKQLKVIEQDGQLVLKTNNEQDYYVGNQHQKLDTFVAEAMKANKLYKLTENTPPPNQAAQQTGQQPQAAQQTGQQYSAYAARLAKMAPQQQA